MARRNGTEEIWKGEDELRPLLKPLATLELDPANLNLHDERSVKTLARMLGHFGQKKPIVGTRQNGRIIARAGNGILQAARELQWTHLAVVASAMSEQRAREYAVADNRSAQLSQWDFLRLAPELKSLMTDGSALEILGFLPEEFDSLQGLFDTPAVQAEGAVEGDDLLQRRTYAFPPEMVPLWDRQVIRLKKLFKVEADEVALYRLAKFISLRTNAELEKE